MPRRRVRRNRRTDPEGSPRRAASLPPLRGSRRECPECLVRVSNFPSRFANRGIEPCLRFDRVRIRGLALGRNPEDAPEVGSTECRRRIVEDRDLDCFRKFVDPEFPSRNRGRRLIAASSGRFYTYNWREVCPVILFARFRRSDFFSNFCSCRRAYHCLCFASNSTSPL